MKFIKVILLSTFIFLANAGSILAIDTPVFPACSNPQGTLIASYDNGTHGVVGGLSYSGSDKVYKINDLNLTQCLCSDDGRGIQTNWWKASSLSDDEINILKADGWIYVSTGSVWGLEESAYMAKNIDYSCSSSSSNGTGGVNTSNSGSSIGQVLGLAFTGNIKLIYAIFALGILLLAYGQILHRARN